MRRQADAFEDALQASARGEPVEERLVPLLQATRLVGGLAHVPPAPRRLLPGRQRFLSEAARLRETRAPQRGRTSLALRLAMSLAALALLFGILVGVDRAAAASLPGDTLYGAKLAAERVHAALAFGPQSRFALAQSLAEERMDEILALIGAGREVRPSVSSRAAEQLREALSAAVQLEGMSAPVALESLADAIGQREQAMRSAIGEPPQPTVDEFLREMARVREEAHAGQGDPDGLRQRLRYGTPPVPTILPGPSGTPQPSRTPDPQPSHAPGASDLPPRTGQPSVSPAPSGSPAHTPGSTATREPTGNPPVSHTPGASHTPDPTGQPGASRTPGPTGGPGQTPGNGGGGGSKP
ncbi:MAG TPA: DUF5667 domain-containing protein [Anaerolineae bacterium]|nr:DUF5667 domain-containing protein [Anaerolineae bacterium]